MVRDRPGQWRQEPHPRHDGWRTAVDPAAHAAALDSLVAGAAAEGLTCVVGAVVVDGTGRVFLQRRALTARLFPDCWDIIGGHVEAGEQGCAALARELEEETGWQLRAIGPVVRQFDWVGRDGVARREVDMVVAVGGDLAAPRIEQHAFRDWGWFDARSLRARAARGDGGDTGMIEVALDALMLLHDGPDRP